MKFTSLFALLNVASAKMSFGSCPTDVPVVDDMDPARMAGNWYEITRDWDFPFTMGSECGTRYYELRDDDYADLDFHWRSKKMFGGYGGAAGSYFNCGTSDEWTCQINMTESPDSRIPFHYMEVDYDDYNINYGCFEFDWMPGVKMEFFFILSRNPTMSNEQRLELE